MKNYKLSVVQSLHMSNYRWLVGIFLIVFAGNVFGGKKMATKKPLSASQKNLNLSTSVRFDGSAVNGKFQSATNSLATVEDDKYLNDLLGVRSNFNDRVEAEKSRY